MREITMETDTSRLAYALAFTFLVPLVGYLTGLAWNKMVGVPPQVNKAWSTFCLVVPIVGLVMFVTVDLDLIRRLWSTSPYVLLVCVIVFGTFAPAVLIAVIVRLWRTKPNRYD